MGAKLLFGQFCLENFILTRMHSSRMRTARSSSHHGGVSIPLWRRHPWSRHPPHWSRPSLSRHPPARSPSTSPLAVGLDQIPRNLPLGCWPGDPPGQIPLNFPLGCGPGNLQSMLGYHTPHPGYLLQGMLGYHPPCGQTDPCKNIQFTESG